MAAVLGVGMVALAVDAAAKIPGIDDLPPCAPDFADGCVTVRTAVVIGEGFHYSTGRGNSWGIGVKRWNLRLEEPGPHGQHGVSVDLRNQAGRERLSSGGRVIVAYVGENPAWVELSDGTILDTDDHPRYSALMYAAMGLCAGGFGGSFIQTAISRARRRGSWVGSVDIHLEPNIGLFVAVGGLAAFCLQFLLPRPAPIAMGVLLLILFASIWISPWGRFLHGRRPRPRHAARRSRRHVASKDR